MRVHGAEGGGSLLLASRTCQRCTHNLHAWPITPLKEPALHAPSAPTCQNSTTSGRSRKPPQCGGRGTCGVRAGAGGGAEEGRALCHLEAHCVSCWLPPCLARPALSRGSTCRCNHSMAQHGPARPQRTVTLSSAYCLSSRAARSSSSTRPRRSGMDCMETRAPIWWGLQSQGREGAGQHTARGLDCGRWSRQ